MADCVIFAGADMDVSCIRKDTVENAFVICADRGLIHAKKAGIAADLIVGDFDSLGYVPHENCKVMSYPTQKDDTDLMIAIKQAISAGKNDIIIYGALGGRLDHTISNIQALSFAADHGCRAELVSANEKVLLLMPGTYSFTRNDGFSLSLFSYTEKVSGLTIKGAKYCVDNSEINNSFPIGISNEIVTETAQISFKSGRILVIRSAL